MGGKTHAIKSILAYIPSDIKSLISPFIGGGSLEVRIASLGISVLGYDIDPYLVSFWQAVLSNPTGVANDLTTIGRIDRTKYGNLLRKLKEGVDEFSPAVYYSLNRTSFMAQIGAGISTNPQNNLTERLIERVRQFKCPNLKVFGLDFRKVIERSSSNDFLYLDPPYYVALHKDKYYPFKNFTPSDHLALFNLLNKRDNWILSYDNVPEVRERYKEYIQIPLQWIYSNGKGSYKPKEPKELLILSKNLRG